MNIAQLALQKSVANSAAMAVTKAATSKTEARSGKPKGLGKQIFKKEGK